MTLPPEPICLDADPVRLAQVFANLLNNACKYTEPGGHIWLTAERQGSDVVVRVKDTGIGIPTDMLPKSLRCSRKCDRTLERSQGGLGIGLTLVKRLVEMHGGTVRPTAKDPDRGVSSSSVCRSSSSRRKADTPEPITEPSRTTDRRILVVDDNEDSASSLAILLRITGNEMQTAHDGLEAVEAARNSAPMWYCWTSACPS